MASAPVGTIKFVVSPLLVPLTKGSMYTTIMELGPIGPSVRWFWGPNSRSVVYLDPLIRLQQLLIDSNPHAYKKPLTPGILILNYSNKLLVYGASIYTLSSRISFAMT